MPAGEGAGYGMDWQGNPGSGGSATYEAGIPVNLSVSHSMKDQSYWSFGQSAAGTVGKAFGGTQDARMEGMEGILRQRVWRRWAFWIRGIYLSGVAALLFYFTAVYMGWKRKLSATVRQRENIWYSERISSPFVMGVLRPRIYLPYGLDPQEEKSILLHEKTHIRHLDPLLRLLGTFALCLHWWNPLVWLGIHCFYQDMEMFCDEAAMGKADLSRRRAYAETLLRFAVRQSGPGMAPAFGETHTEQRIRNILRPKRRGRWITLAVALFAAAGAAIFLTVPQGSRAKAGDDMELPGQGGSSMGETEKQDGVSGAGTGDSGQPGTAGNSSTQSDQELESFQNLVLSQSPMSPVEGQTLTVQLVMTEGVYYTREQVPESLFPENYEGSYQLRTLDAQERLLDAVDLTNGQGGAVMNFPFRDFPWYFEDYNLDGQQDFFLGTCTGDSENYQSYHYLMTVTAEGEIGYLYDGPMWAGFWTLDAENITNMFLESGGGEPDYRTFFLYQMNREYSSHDYYTWEPYFGEYRKSVVFTGVYPQGQDREAADYLEGAWRVAGVDMWDQEQSRPDNRIGEVLSYENGSFRQLNQAGALAYAHATRGVSSLLQSKEEFWDTYNMLFPGDNEEPVRRILVNAGEDCLFGNVVYVVSENEMRVCDLENTGTFWTVIREDLRGEAREVQEYLQGTWEITGIASRPYDALEQKEAEAFLGTKLTYDWHNKAGEFAIEGVYNYSMPALDAAWTIPPTGPRRRGLWRENCSGNMCIWGRGNSLASIW